VSASTVQRESMVTGRVRSDQFVTFTHQ